MSSQKFLEKIDFAHRSGALARPGSRELRAVKILTSYDVWRPSKRRKNVEKCLKFIEAGVVVEDEALEGGA